MVRMSNTPDDGGPAFPSDQGHIPEGTWNQTYDPGLSLRDYMAIHLACPDKAVDSYDHMRHPWKLAEDRASLRYLEADAMLKARGET